MSPARFASTVALAVAAGLAGCVAPPPKAPRLAVDFSKLPPEPQCRSPRHCEVMMAQAVEWLPQLAGMKLQIATPNMIETFNPTSYGRMYARAQLVPITSDVSTVRITLSCYRDMDCNEEKFIVLKEMRELMTAAGNLYLGTAKPVATK